MIFKAFDIEVYPEWWCIVCSLMDKDSKKIVIRSDKDYSEEILRLSYDSCLIGFNIKGYDLKILNAIQHNYAPSEVYEVSQAIMNKQECPYNDYCFWNKYNFSDLYDDWKGSLKEFESNLCMSVKETSVPFGKKNLSEEEKLEISKYCENDVDAVIKMWNYRQAYVNGKIVLGSIFGIKENTALKSTYAKLDALILNAKKTKRDLERIYKIPIKIESYIRKYIPSDVLKLFEKINYKEDSKKEVIFGKILFFNNIVSFGSGGIHSTICTDRVKEFYNSPKNITKKIKNNIMVFNSNNKVLMNIDVTSYYPNWLILFDYLSRNATSPHNYSLMYNMRPPLKAQAKEEEKLNGKTPLWAELFNKQNSLKLGFNIAYGATKNKHNDLYDPYQATSLCYSGQLYLAALANQLYTELGIDIIQSNTDGLLIYFDKYKSDKVNEIIKEWENRSGFVMEKDIVKAFYQRDVNNYIEVTDSTKSPYKIKGKWCNQFNYEKDYLLEDTSSGNGIPNLNAPITHLAILNYYVNNIPIEETINNCNEVYAFCFTTKTGRTYEKTYYFYDDKPIEANKVNRVVATTDKKCGTIKKYKLTTNKKGEIVDKFDKIAEISNHVKLLNDELTMIPDLDKQWYINFTKNKLEELEWIE